MNIIFLAVAINTVAILMNSQNRIARKIKVLLKLLKNAAERYYKSLVFVKQKN